MRIAMISEHASPLAVLGGVDSGGQNVYVAHLARQLVQQGHAVDVFTRRDSPTLPDVVPWEGIRVIHVPAGPPTFIRKEELLSWMDAFAGWMAETWPPDGYDLVHAHFWMSGLVAAELKRRLGVPMVITFHALGRVRRLYQGAADGFPDDRETIEDRLVAEADRIIAECPQDAHDLMQRYHADPSKLTLVPCGYDPDEFGPVDKHTARTAIGLPHAAPLVLQLGRMVPRKGVDTVVQAIARLRRRHHLEATLAIVGGESDEPDPAVTPEIARLQDLAAAEDVADHVVFVGRRGRDVLKYYYSAADVFVSTPWYEPFGMTPLEAMACATPVVGSRVGGIKFTVAHGRTGYLVPPRDPDALAARLASLLRHPRRLQQFGDSARQRAAQFTWARMSQAMASVYGDVLTTAAPSRLERTGAIVHADLSGEPSILTASTDEGPPLGSPPRTNDVGVDGSDAHVHVLVGPSLPRAEQPGLGGLPRSGRRLLAAMLPAATAVWLWCPRRVPRGQRAVFLDKDGTLIPNLPYNVDPELVRLSGGAAEALLQLHAAGYRLIVVSNQPGAALGHFGMDALGRVEERLRRLLDALGVPLAGMYVCPHHPEGQVRNLAIRCACRKPQPGLLRLAAREHGIDLRRSWCVGDILDDVEAGRAAGCRTILVTSGGETEWRLSPRRWPHATADDLSLAARIILAADR